MDEPLLVVCKVRKLKSNETIYAKDFYSLRDATIIEVIKNSDAFSRTPEDYSKDCTFYRLMSPMKLMGTV